MTWYFHNTPIEFTENDVKDHFGFVYLITHNQSGRKYIGKKFFTKSKTKQVKGKKKKTRVKSDWEDYYGSNKELLDEIKINGKDNYTREVLHLCRTRSECQYFETYEIFCRHALLSDSYYNQWCSCRIRKAHLISKCNT